MPDLECRVARLESRLDSMEKDTFIKLEEIKDAIEDLKVYQRNQQGFVRGVVFTVSAIVGGIGLAFNWRDR